MISHHHHDNMENNFSIGYNHDDDHSHHIGKHHHQHNSQDKDKHEKENSNEHNHSLPIHQHISTLNDVDRLSTTFQRTNKQNISLKLILALSPLHNTIKTPQCFISDTYKSKPFIISSCFEPGTIALRGPPSIV